MAPFAAPGLAILLSFPPSVSDRALPPHSWTSTRTVLCFYFSLCCVFCLLSDTSSRDLYSSQSFQLQTGLKSYLLPRAFFDPPVAINFCLPYFFIDSS